MFAMWFPLTYLEGVPVDGQPGVGDESGPDAGLHVQHGDAQQVPRAPLAKSAVVDPDPEVSGKNRITYMKFVASSEGFI